MDHDMNVTILNPELKKIVSSNLDLKNKSDISRFLTFIVCACEGEKIEDEMVEWSEEEYEQYLRKVGINEETDQECVEEFLRTF